MPLYLVTWLDIFSGDSPCSNNNGGCSDICQPAPGGGVHCRCPDYSGTRLSNNDKMCIPWPNNCTHQQFACRNRACISYRYVCNLEDDCGDGTDEDARYCGKQLPKFKNFRYMFSLYVKNKQSVTLFCLF